MNSRHQRLYPWRGPWGKRQKSRAYDSVKFVCLFVSWVLGLLLIVNFYKALRRAANKAVLCTVQTVTPHLKQAKQIQEQLKEPHNGKNYSLKASSTMAKSENLVKNHVQLQNYSKAERHPVTALEKMMESSFAGPQSFPEVPSPDRGSQSVKHHRYR
uniref:Uncharacterized protein n=1 Tax=Capra hircus TaxID=9925 RepID=A0A8C2R0H0_CAPHI